MRTLRTHTRRMSLAVVWMAALSLPVNAAWIGDCGCGQPSPRAESSQKAAKHSGCTCCRGAGSQGCGDVCHCGDKEPSKPVAPVPANSPATKQLTDLAAVPPAIAAPMALASIAMPSAESLQPTFDTPLDLCSEFCRFLL